MRYEFVVELKPVWPKPRAGPTLSRLNTPIIQRTLVMAYQIADYMAANNLLMFKDFCRHAHITAPRATQIMNMLLLSPRIQEQILSGDTPKVHRLRERDIRPLLKEAFWPRQEELWQTLP